LEKIQEIAKTQEPFVIDQNDVEDILKKLKTKKAEDFDGWKNELLISGGEEMEASLVLMCNKISENLTTPEQWNTVIVKSF
jgi:hypothetical protein